MEPSNLIAARHVQLASDDFHPERLEQTRRKTSPSQLVEFVVDAGNDPYVTVEGADRRATVREEIKSTDERVRVPRIRHGRSEIVDDVRAITTARGHCSSRVNAKNG